MRDKTFTIVVLELFRLSKWLFLITTYLFLTYTKLLFSFSGSAEAGRSGPTTNPMKRYIDELGRERVNKNKHASR